MGAEKLKAAVVDAGPLIHLFEIDCIHLLNNFPIFHIPDAVWREAVAHNRLPENSITAIPGCQRHAIPSHAIAKFKNENHLEELHDGEQECLYLCRQMNISILLTDDLAVRDAAKRLNVTPVGSLGIIVKAYQLGRIAIEDAELHLGALYDISSLFVTREIVDLAIEQLRRRLK